MANSAKFIDAFSRIEKFLRRQAGADRQVPFYQLVELSAAKAPAVRRYRDDLKEFADLRNAIVHERSDGHPIAEPHDHVLRELQRMVAILEAPPLVLPLFQRPVFTVQPDDKIAGALKLFWPKNFSQAPVVTGGRVVGILTSNTVSRWLAAQAGRELVDLAEHQVDDAMKHTEHESNWRVTSRVTPLADVVDAFDAAEASGRRLDAVLITHTGKASEALLGIITIHDMPKVLRAITVKKSSAP